MVERIMDRARQIWRDKPISDIDTPMSAWHAWNEAVYELLQTDDDALAVLNDIVPFHAKGEIFWSSSGSGTFVAFIREAISNKPNPFEEQLTNELPDYTGEMSRRRQLLEDQTSSTKPAASGR